MALKIGRHEHHILASLIAGREKEGLPISDAEASRIVGYAPATISMLRQQKDFRALIDHYKAEVGPPAQPHTAERIEALGLSTLEELQARLVEDPDSWTKRELIELADLLLVKAGALKDQRPVAGPSGVRVAIQFVEARPRELPAPSMVPEVVDMPVDAQVDEVAGHQG